MQPVSTISGTRSCWAFAVTFTALATPGPTVATRTAGAPVMWCTPSAMKPALFSCLQRMKVIPAFSSASTSVSTSPPGMPKA